MKRFLLIASLFISLSGCSLLDSTVTINKPEEKIKKAAIKAPHRWWEIFHDPLMNRMAEDLLKQNLDIQIAKTRIDEARGALRVSESKWFPSLDATGSASRGNSQLASSKTYSISKGGFDTQWEIDLFGQTKSEVSAAEARLQAQIASVNDMKNIMVAELVRSIIEWRQAHETIRKTKDLLVTQDKQISLLKIRNNAGLVDAISLSRAQAERAQTATRLPLAQAAADTARFKIARLLATTVEQLKLEKQEQYSFTIPSPNHSVKITLDTIRKRPDIRALRAEMLAAQSDLSKAENDLWPRFSIGAFFGIQDTSHGLKTANNPIWSLSSSITTPLLNFGRLHGAVDISDAKARAASLNYENGILIALQETQTALSDYINGINAASEQEKALSYRKDTVKLATERFEKGLTDMMDLTTAQSELNQATITLIERRSEAAIAYIRLQKAIGTTLCGLNQLGG